MKDEYKQEDIDNIILSLKELHQQQRLTNKEFFVAMSLTDDGDLDGLEEMLVRKGILKPTGFSSGPPPKKEESKEEDGYWDVL